MKPESLSVDLESLSLTPELLAQHSITPEEYQRIVAALGRAPGLTELGIYSVMWSEHCSYKSSRVHLKRLPTHSARVVQGPGENAGIIDVGDGWACAFKIESHNHPSFIEPFQGAATGVGGILRDLLPWAPGRSPSWIPCVSGPSPKRNWAPMGRLMPHRLPRWCTRTIPCWKAWSAESQPMEIALACPT